MEVLSIVLPYILEIAATLILALLGVVGAWIGQKLAKREQLGNIMRAIEHVVVAVSQTVRELNQTLVEGYKSQSADGKLTKAQIAHLGAQLHILTMQKLSDPVVALLEAAKVDLNALIQGVAESYLGKQGGHCNVEKIEQGD